MCDEYMPMAGTGVVGRTNDNPIIHFGTPADVYEWVETRKRWWRR